MKRSFRSPTIIRSALVVAGVGGLTGFCGTQEEIMELKGGSETTSSLAAGEAHEGHLSMEEGQLVRAVAYQLDVDVAVELYDAQGDLIVKVDSPIGREGPERILAVAESTGTFRLVVRAVERNAPKGRYRLVVDELQPATEDDRRRAGAEKLFSQAEELRREGTSESREKAIERYREALGEWQALNDRGREADTHFRLGWVYRDLRQRADAAAFLTTARSMYRELGDGPGEALALNYLAGLWIRSWAHQAALPLVDEALEIARGIDNKFIVADCLTNLGVIQRRSGKTDEALGTYREALDLLEEIGEPAARARIRTNIGVLLVERNKLKEAADELEAAVEIWKSLDEPERVARALSYLGDVRRREGRLDEALDLFTQALDLRRQADDALGEGVTLNSIGTNQLLLGSRDHERGARDEAREWYEQSKSSYEQALRIFREHQLTREEAVALLNLGRLHKVMGEPERALEYHRGAVQLIDESGDRQAEASNLYGMARSYHDLADFEAARRHLDDALDKVEDLRTESLGEGLRIAFFASRQHYYELFVDVLMHLHQGESNAGHDATAFAAAERRRARALLDALGESTAEIRRHADPKLLEEERTLQEELNELEKSRTVLLSSPGGQEKIDDIEKEQRGKTLALEQLRGRLRSDLAQPAPCSLTDTQYLLEDGTLLLAYSLGDERSFLWRVSEKEMSSYVLPGRKEIETLALEAHELLTSQSENREEQRERVLAELSQRLLGDVASELDGQRLAVVAEGALLYLPFAALPGPQGMTDPPKYLVERHEIVYLPSISVLRQMRQQLKERYPAPRQLALFADPALAGSVPAAEVAALGFEPPRPLPYTRTEAEEILKLARGETMEAIGVEATKKKVLEGRLEEYQILHFATHGVADRARPELSGLVLSLFDDHGEYQDGYLRLHEIYGLHLPAELAVLSACETGVGQQVRGEGFLGLTRGFMYAGTPRLLASLWKVEDGATAELMKRFYWSLLEAQAPPALALRAAQMKMLASEKWRHPYDWAGFVFQGEWSLPGDVPPGEEPPIEESASGGVEEDVSPISYPGPDKRWCESLEEPWMEELCNTLRRLGDRDDG